MRENGDQVNRSTHLPRVAGLGRQGLKGLRDLLMSAHVDMAWCKFRLSHINRILVTRSVSHMERVESEFLTRVVIRMRIRSILMADVFDS